MGILTKFINSLGKQGGVLLLPLSIMMMPYGVATASMGSEVVERIKPYGEVQVEDKAPSNQSEDKEELKVSSVAVKAKYEKYCAMCHTTGVAGALKFRDKATWAQIADKDMDAILVSAMQGIGSMPPKGACMACSKEELKSIIEYMMPQ